METKTIHLHLKGFGHSGRGVGLRQIGVEEYNQIERNAATTAGQDGTVYDFKQALYADGIARMVVEITEPCEDKLPSDDSAWQPMTLQRFETAGGLKAFFTQKDVEFLRQVWRKLHEVNTEDVDAIVGKAIAGASLGSP